MKAPLHDQASRDRFVTELNRNYCVSAGAGAGKTTAIVERIASIARERPEALSKLVVVTYGKAAAEELRSRSRLAVLRDLGEPGEGGKRNPRRITGPGLHRRVFFGTIHSFCLALVQEQGRRLGLPVALELLEETEEIWARFADSLDFSGLDLPKDCLAEALRFVSVEELFAIAKKMAPGDAERLHDQYEDLMCPDLTFEKTLAAASTSSRDKTAANQAALREWLEDHRSGSEYLKLPEAKTGSRDFKESFREEMKPFVRRLGSLVARIASTIALAFREFRVAEGFMTYDDQVLWCRELIRNPAILERLRERNYSVILDEAQDTDSDMFSILAEITRPAGAAIGGWPHDKAAPGPEPGRFCFVGDDQQAIFASRADVSTYREYVDAYRRGQGGESLEFSVTMRCPSRVIAIVNRIFVADGRLAQEHVTFRELLSKPGARDGAVWLLPIEPKIEESAGVDARFEAECRQVAAFLGRQGTAGLGVESWGEVAVLCPRHKWLAQAARVFRREGLACRLVANKQIELELAPRTWPVSFLHVLLNPWDEFELIGVLREIFAISDVELAEAHLANDGLKLSPANPVAPRLAEALGLLRRIRAELPPNTRGTLSRFVNFALEESCLAARLEAIGEKSDCLDSFRHEALAAECEGLFLREWVAERVRQLRHNADELRESGNEIQMLTNMKAKGLEWPVVIPLGLGRAISGQKEGFPSIRRRGRKIELHFTEATVDPDMEEEEARREREELQRVFYVTLTRSKSLLVLPDGRSLYKASDISFLALSKWEEIPPEEGFCSPPGRMAAFPGSGVSMQALLRAAPADSVMEIAARNSKLIPKRILPHELAGRASHHPLAETGMLSETGGLDYGLWWHQTIEHFPWKGPPAEQESYLELAGRQAAGDSVFSARAEHELKKWSGSPLAVELIKRGGIFLPEIPFSHPRSEEEWLEGVIDLVVVMESGGLWIVDWKTDRRFAGEEEEAFGNRLVESYQSQLRAYKEVLETGMKRKVERLVLYSTESAGVYDL